MTARLDRAVPLLLALGLALGACGSPPGPVTPAGVASPRPAAPAPTVAPSTSAPPVAAAGFDPCSESKPLEKKYTGLLRNARCDQERFLTMSAVAEQLGVDCSYCHVRSREDPKKFDYPVMTPRKEIANWMGLHFASSLQAKDGSPVKCKSCHTDDAGHPVAKILGNPRDLGRAQEWMTLVLVNRFDAVADPALGGAGGGQRLRCQTCHADNFSKPGFQPKVILRTERIPPHATLP